MAESDDDTDIALEFVETDKLIEELMSRFPGIVVVIEAEVEGKPGENESKIYYNGGNARAKGLCISGLDALREDSAASRRKIKEDEQDGPT